MFNIRFVSFRNVNKVLLALKCASGSVLVLRAIQPTAVIRVRSMQPAASVRSMVSMAEGFRKVAPFCLGQKPAATVHWPFVD